MIIWLTGQPGSGKTTLARNIIEKIENENSNRKIINIDGGQRLAWKTPDIVNAKE